MEVGTAAERANWLIVYLFSMELRINYLELAFKVGVIPVKNAGFSSSSDERGDPDLESKALNAPVDLCPSFADNAVLKGEPW